MFHDHVLDFYEQLQDDWKLPKGVDLIYPFGHERVRNLMENFSKKYYTGKQKRRFLFGINPGRFGAGMTGIPFTDPIILSEVCGIENTAPRKNELSSIFIYDVIDQFGGPLEFYKHYYISSVCPLGFTKENKNYNCYDSKELYNCLKDIIIHSIEYQISKYCHRDIAYSIGQGKNYKILCDLNAAHGWFENIVPLPHPRWVMQYKRKTKDVYIDEYLIKLEN